MRVTVKKTVELEYELPDDYFDYDEVGNEHHLNRDQLIAFCEATDGNSEFLLEETSEVDEISFQQTGARSPEIITEEDYKEYCKSREDAERCYECGGYGDDYDDEGNCNCDSCPFNGDED